MPATLRARFGVLSAGLVCLLLSYAVAQQDTPIDKTRVDANSTGQADRATTEQVDPTTSGVGGRTVGEFNQNRLNYRAAQTAAAGHNPVEHFLAACLLGQNKAEVELSQIALQKSENAEVKQFAQKMVTDHQKMIEQLQPIAMAQGGANRAASSILGGNSEAQGRSETTEGRTSDTRALPGSSGASQTIAPSGTSAAVPPVTATAEATAGANLSATAAGRVNAVHDLMQIERQINDRCLQMAKEELQQKSGAEFDKCYVGNAIGMHAHALAALEVIGKQTQGTLAQVAQQAQPGVQQHLDHAKQLMKQLEGQSSATAQRDTNRTE
jgi:predicted outer membrane protein